MSLRSFFVFLGIIFFTACASNGEGVLKNGAEESLPKVDKSNFKTIEKSGFEFQIFKKMSLNRSGGREIINANYLSKELHFSV